MLISTCEAQSGSLTEFPPALGIPGASIQVQTVKEVKPSVLSVIFAQLHRYLEIHPLSLPQSYFIVFMSFHTI